MTRRKRPSEVESLVDNEIAPSLAHRRPSSLPKVGAVATTCLVLATIYYLSPSAGGGGPPRLRRTSDLRVSTWNVAAINNNPFEYWIDFQDSNYKKLMAQVAEILKDGNSKKRKKIDVRVSEVFTSEMLDLVLKKASKLWDQDSIERTRRVYENDLSKRRIFSEFLKDSEIGTKRLASMPDRVTNTINIPSGIVYRPSVINCYDGPRFISKSDWFEKWLNFMFNDLIIVKNSKGDVKESTIAESLVKISRQKYPAISEEESDISLPLQTVVLAIFDAVLFTLVQEVTLKWQDVRSDICENLNKNKSAKVLEVVNEYAKDSDVLCLQEVSKSFLSKELEEVDGFLTVLPPTLAKRDQNSVILLNKQRFDPSTVVDVTTDVSFPEGKDPTSPGDLVSIKVQDWEGNLYHISSFHGDTNGLATVPTVEAVLSVSDLEKERLIFGLDANTYRKGERNKKQDVVEFSNFLNSKNLASCYGAKPPPKGWVTTYNARTFLQPQFNKASTAKEIESKGDVNPKDFIIVNPKFSKVSKVIRDNTGNRMFTERTVVPSLDFPSDHAVLSAEFKSLKSSLNDGD